MLFISSLAGPRKLILDGATGTELNRRGVDTGLPLWSANALMNDRDAKILQQIHEDYLLAGADIVTTNTFRTHRRALAPSGNADRALELTQRAVDIARAAIVNVPADTPRYLAGSISTLEDCYRPDLVPPDNELRAEHSEQIHHIVECGVDLILIETINTIRESVIMAKLAAISGIPVVVSFVCDREGKLLSGESLTDAANQLLPLGIAAIGVNCGPTPFLAKPLVELKQACGINFPLIAYGNIGYADEKVGWINTDSENPEVYCEHALDWPAKIIGGCCGTTPEHIRQLKSS
ncbi:MAG TPA: homocysteine S-methyltransferase family protein, partial [Anaerolineales bacterium]|nr:homocysteine S-methyltransferase family protein [Anaerolineales bacterium]